MEQSRDKNSTHLHLSVVANERKKKKKKKDPLLTNYNRRVCVIHLSHIHQLISVELATVVESNPNAFFSLATTLGVEEAWQQSQESCEQYWTSPGGNTPPDSSYMATYNPSWKLSKLDEPDMQDPAREVMTNS